MDSFRVATVLPSCVRIIQLTLVYCLSVSDSILGNYGKLCNIFFSKSMASDE